MNRKLIALLCMFLIVLTPFTVADIEDVEDAVDEIPGLENTQLDPGFDELVPTIDGEFNEDNEYDTGESIVLNVVEYEPKVLTSNLIEDNNVPVYAFLSATSFGNFVQGVGEVFGDDMGVSDLEPLYGGFQIENVRIRPADVGTQDIIAGQPKYIKPGKFTSDNAGYIYMTLKQIEAEADIPDNINMTFNAEVWFSEVTRLYSLAQTSLVLPIDPDYDEWSDKLDSEGSRYTFFGNRGLIRVKEVSGNDVLLTVYSNKDLYWPIIGAPRAIADVKLSKGQTSRYIDLGETDEAALGLSKFEIKLDSIKDPSENNAVVSVTVDGNSQNMILTEGMSIFPGSSWTVDTIYSAVTSEGKDYTIVLSGGGNRKTLTTYVGQTQEEAGEFLNRQFYPSAMRNQVTDALIYEPGDARIDSVSISQMGNEFNGFSPSIYIDVSEISGSSAVLNSRTLQQGDTLKEVLYDVLPAGYYFKVENNKVVIDYFSESDPCASIDTYDNGLTVIITDAEKYSTEVKRELYCTAIEGYKAVIDNYDNIYVTDDTTQGDQARMKIADTYEELKQTYSSEDDEYRNSVQQAIDALEGVSSSGLSSSAQERIGNYQEGLVSDAVYAGASIEDNGRDVYVELKEVQTLTEENKPTVTLILGGATKTYKLGDYLFSGNKQNELGEYNYKVNSVGDDYVSITQTYINPTSSKARDSSRTYDLGEMEDLDGTEMKILSTEAKKEVHLTIIPGTGKPMRATTNFTLHIPVEKRLFQLNPEKIDDKIEKAKKLQEKLDKNIEVLDKILETWNKICYGVFAIIELKLLFGQGNAAARHDVVRGLDDNGGWYTWCEEHSGYANKDKIPPGESWYSTVDNCMMQHASEIQNNIDSAEEAWAALEADPSAYESQEWYTEAVEGYGGEEDLANCISRMGDDAFLTEDSKMQLGYNQVLKEKLSGSSSVFAEEVNTKLETYSVPEMEGTGYFESRQAGCKAMNTALEGDDLDGADNNTIMAAARAAYFSGSASVTAAMPIITSYPGAGLVELAEKSDNVILKNVGYANKLGTNSYVVYDDGIAHSNIQPLKFFKLDDIYLDHKTGTGLETSLQQEIDTINGESFTNDRENVLVDSNGMQLYFREEGGKAYIYAANPSYSSGEIVREYSDDAEFVLYGSGTNKGMPYCIPYTSSAGDFLKIIEYSANNDIQTMQYWNVGSDGNLCTGDDILVRHESQFAYEQAYGTGSVANYGDLYSYANKYVRMDFTGKTTMPIGGIDFRVRQDKGGITYEGSTSSCFDVMEPNDCKLLFNVCDPVMCPPSRFTMQGRWQVDNVIQSGMIGSLVLGWGNGDAFPICLTGVQASLHYWKSMLDAYVDCLETSKYEGKTVGICDKLQSVYLCEIIVNEVAAIFDSQGGLLGLFNKNSFGERASGGEYLKFQENVQSTKDAFTYFTTEYSQTAFGAFKGRSFKEIGTTICKSAVYGKMPVFGDFMSKLSQPEDPTQFFATLMVRPYSEANDQSAYQVYYHIYAGSNENIPRVVYSVRLYNSITGEKYPMTGKCGGVSGTIDNAGMVDETIDCILDNTAGGEYDQVCIVINGDETCGFGQVSTMFSTEYVKDMFVADEAMRNVSTQEQCYPSYPTASPTISQVGSTNVILPYQFGEFTSGIRRVCSIENPGMGQGNSNDWKNIGTCGNDHEGRFLGYCWMDSETVTVKDAKRSATVDEWMTENDFKNNALAAGIGELYDETKSAEKIAELEEQHKGANCASLTTLPPQLSDFLDRSVSYSHSAQAWMLMGQTYRDIVQKCDVKGSVDVEVKFVVNSLEESTPGGSAYPIYVDAGDSIELEISGISSQDVVDIDSNIFGPSNCDPSSTPYKCSFTIAMSDQTDESAHISITLGGDERFNQNFVFTTKTEVGTALQSTMSDCSKCGVLGLRCTSTICHNNGEDCFYETAGTLNGCDSCYHLSSCSQLNGDEHRCWSNSVCLRAAGLRCAWDSNTSTCVNEGGGEVGSVGRDPISDYEEYQQPPHPSNLARVIAENWVLNSPTSQQSADMTTDADRDGNPDAGKEHRSVWTSPCCGAWTGLILSDAGFEEKYYITDVGYNGMTAPYNTIGEVINDWGYPIVINERCGCSKYDSQCNSQTCGSGDYCGYGNLCNTRRYGSHSYLLLGVGPESKEFYLYEIETMVGIDDNVRQDMIDSLDAKGTFSNTDALLVGYSGSTYGTVFGKIDINQLPSNNNGELRWPIRQLKPFAPR